RSPARLDDELEITCEPQPQGAASRCFAQRIYRGARAGGGAPGPRLLAEASVRVACVDARTLRPKRLPEFLTQALVREVSADG
ncbi:MAG TPA: hypothetical protein VFK87_03445, partial [Steroidobacteraceae bacterium]|nr:hypothetical protein [Steroidobacteraceae bacterium]